MSTGVCQCYKCGGIYDDETDCKCAAKEPTKQAGDVKRYDTYPDPDDKMKEHKRGDWVKFEDVAHLLKPQEPGEKPALNHALELCLDLTKQRNELEAENRRLTSVLKEIASSQVMYSGHLRDLAREALK